MEKQINHHKSYYSLSKLEIALLNSVEPFTVFSVQTIKRLTKWKKSTINNILTNLKYKRIITPIKKNNYVLVDKIVENTFQIAQIVTSPSYISYWTAASYYGFTEQQVKTIQVVSTKQHPSFNFSHFTIETINTQPCKFYGYQKIKNFAIVTPEKLIIEILNKPEKTGGLEEVIKIIKNAWPIIDQKIIYTELQKFGSKSLFARLGYILEQLNLKCNFNKKLLNNLPKGYVKLNPQKKKSNKYIKKWKIIENDK